MSALSAIYFFVAAYILMVVTDSPPYVSRRNLLIVAAVAMLWPLVLAFGLPLWLWLRFSSRDVP